MSLTYGFCLGELGTENDSAQFSEAFHAVFGDGITRYRNQFSVKLNGFSAALEPGFALAAGRWLKNEDNHTLTLPTAGNTRDRWDALAVQVDFAARKASLDVLVDVDPDAIRADLGSIRNGERYSLVLYFVHVRRGATTLAPDDVTDVRGEGALCGYLPPLSAAAEQVLSVYEYLISGLDRELEALAELGGKAVRTGDRAIAYLDRQAEAVSGNALGDVMLSAVRPVPERHWLLCDGSAVPEEYPGLSELLGGVMPDLPQEDGRLKAWVFGAEERVYTGGHEDDTYTVTVPVVPAGGGTASGEGVFRQGSMVSLLAAPSAGNEFVAWRENGAEISSKTAYQFPLYCNRTITAVFTAVYKITVSVTPAGSGTASGGGTYRAGASVTVKAAVPTGKMYQFVEWTENSQKVSANASYTFIAEKDRSLTAVFKERFFEWMLATLPSSAQWQSITYGGSKFVVVGDGGAVIYSTNGTNWLSADKISLSIDWVDVAYGNGKFVVVGGTNKAAYSTDGKTWTESSIPTSSGWRSVAYGNGKFVAVAGQSVLSSGIVYSTNGIDWTEAAAPDLGYWLVKVAYGNGKFVATGYNAYSNGEVVLYSTDGINWKTATLPATTTWGPIAWGNGKFVVLTYRTNRVAYSTDAINWYSAVLPVEANWQDITYGDGKFLAVVYNNNVAVYSADGINWTQTLLPISANWRSVTYGNGKFMAVASGSDKAAYGI